MKPTFTGRFFVFPGDVGGFECSPLGHMTMERLLFGAIWLAGDI